MIKKKNKLMLFLALLLLGITVGYALLSTNLNINGTSTINKPTWDIHFENIVTKSGSVTPATAANITNGGKTVSYSVTLSIPGDYYEFDVDVKNAGTIDGMIKSITSTANGQPVSNLPSYIEYYVTYSDGVEIQNNHLLAAGTKETYTVHIGFKKDIELEDLPGSNQTYNLSFEFTDIQATSDAVQKPDGYVYFFDSATLGDTLATSTPTYDSCEAAMEANHVNVCVRTKLVNNKVSDVYVGFDYDGIVYYLKAFVDETNLSSKPVYESNKAIIESAFGNSFCEENEYTNGNAFSCKNLNSNLSYLVTTYTDGAVLAYGNSDFGGCEIYGSGNDFWCGY